MSELTRIRASGLSDFFDCPARAEAKHLLGLRMPSSAAATIGTAIHASTGVFDRSTIEGQGLTADDAAGAAVDAIHHPQEDVQWDEDSPEVAESIAVALHHRYCKEIAPQQEYVAVEVICDKLDITDLGISLTGTTDRVRQHNGGYGVSDIKSGKRAVSADGKVETKGHAYQLGVYELLAEQGAGLPITEPAEVVGLQVAKTDKGQRAAKSDPIVGARNVLVGDEDSPGILEVVARMLKSGAFPGNPRSMFCGEKYCPIYGRCRYRM